MGAVQKAWILVFIALAIGVFVSPVLADELVWSKDGVVIKLNSYKPFEWHGLVVRASYVKNDTVRFTAVSPYSSTSAYVYVEVYSYKNATLISTFTLEAGQSKDVIVPENVTVFYLTFYTESSSEKKGPYYISCYHEGVSYPPSLKPFIPFIPLAIFVAIAFRYNYREIAYMMIIYGVFINFIAFLVDPSIIPNTIASGLLSIGLGVLMLVVETLNY